MRRSSADWDVGRGVVAGSGVFRVAGFVGPVPGRSGPLVGMGCCVGSLHPLVCGCGGVRECGGCFDAAFVVGCERP